jgi:hypothetical protein
MESCEPAVIVRLDREHLGQPHPSTGTPRDVGESASPLAQIGQPLHRFVHGTKLRLRGVRGELSAADELGSTRQHFLLNLVKRNSPVLVIVRVLSRFAGATLNLNGPCSFDVVLDFIKAREQPSRNLCAIVRL